MSLVGEELNRGGVNFEGERPEEVDKLVDNLFVVKVVLVANECLDEWMPQHVIYTKLRYKVESPYTSARLL